MSSGIDVSVIIPAYNAVDFLERAVQSVRDQEILSWELILVENGSDDQTFQICKTLSEGDARIRVFQSNKGVSRARNRGLNEAKGNWICFLDADDYLYPDAFRTLNEMISYGKHQEDSEACEIVLFGHNSEKSGARRHLKYIAQNRNVWNFAAGCWKILPDICRYGGNYFPAVR